jgi:hypothetical protein
MRHILEKNLIKQAKEKYTVGALFNPVGTSDVPTDWISEIKGTNFRIYDPFGTPHYRNVGVQERNTKGLVYFNGVWANIINEKDANKTN